MISTIAAARPTEAPARTTTRRRGRALLVCFARWFGGTVGTYQSAHISRRRLLRRSAGQTSCRCVRWKMSSCGVRVVVGWSAGCRLKKPIRYGAGKCEKPRNPGGSQCQALAGGARLDDFPEEPQPCQGLSPSASEPRSLCR
jgi:hypothetical protein